MVANKMSYLTNSFIISKKHPIPNKLAEKASYTSTRMQVLKTMDKMVKDDSILVEKNNRGQATKDPTYNFAYDNINLSTVKNWLRDWHNINNCKIAYKNYFGKIRYRINPKFVCDGHNGCVRIWRIKK